MKICHKCKDEIEDDISPVIITNHENKIEVCYKCFIEWKKVRNTAISDAYCKYFSEEKEALKLNGQ